MENVYRLRACLVIAVIASTMSSCSLSQRTPEATLEAYLDHISAGEMAAACELVDLSLRTALDRFGGCQTSMQSDYPVDRARTLQGAQVDHAKIEIFGDGARVAQDAVTINGVVVDPPVSDLIKHDGRWWIAG